MRSCRSHADDLGIAKLEEMCCKSHNSHCCRDQSIDNIGLQTCSKHDLLKPPSPQVIQRTLSYKTPLLGATSHLLKQLSRRSLNIRDVLAPLSFKTIASSATSELPNQDLLIIYLVCHSLCLGIMRRRTIWHSLPTQTTFVDPSHSKSSIPLQPVSSKSNIFQ